MTEIEVKEWSRENEWNEYKNNIIKNKEEKLLDSYHKEIIGDSEEKKEKKTESN